MAFHRRSAIELVKIRGTNPERTFKGSELWGSIGLWRRPIFLRFQVFISETDSLGRGLNLETPSVYTTNMLCEIHADKRLMGPS